MRPEPRNVAAAGGVLWRPAADGVEVAAIWRPSVGNWSLPKGKLEADEPLLIAACREVEEETGVPPIPQAWLCSARYVLPNSDGDVHKSVDFWSMRTDKPEAGFSANEEIGERRWLPLDQAVEKLDRPRDQQALRSFAELPTITSTLIVAAPAEMDQDDRRPMVTAPLSEAGQRQAVRLAGLVSLYQPDRAYSASARAVVQTVEPVASAAGLNLLGDGIFDAEAHERNPERSTQRLRQFATTPGCAVIGAEESTIADSIAILSDEDGVAVSDVSTRQGQAWVLSFHDSTLVAVERL
ncbi:NUDIX hydrolase [Haloglycomyces albus]|uniref:NUDIX hydrolase n=1 Tax=Haloglycomyces albus TaxID=526067 RepID=UPI00046CC9E2|nr:NUDIX hydrolase [Haloglycomyces albus]